MVSITAVFNPHTGRVDLHELYGQPFGAGYSVPNLQQAGFSPPGPTPTYSDPMVANPGAVELGIGGGYSEDEPNNELASHMVAGGRWLEA